MVDSANSIAAWERAVKDEEYYKALADGRCLRWRPIATRPDDRPVIIVCQVDDDDWSMARVMPKVEALVYGPLGPCSATHWCEDMLGTPYVAPIAKTGEPG